MKSYRRSLFEFSVAELDRELVARGAQVSEKRRFTFSHSRGTPQREAVMEQVRMMYREAPFPDRSLQYVGTEDLVKMIMARTRSTEGGRGIWNDQKMFDMFEIHDEVVRRNAEGVAAICLAEDLEAEGNGFFSLETGHYGELFNLCVCEPFHGQPVVMGPLFTGFLVSPDIIVTAGHCVHEGNIGALRVIFSFKMSEPFSAATRVSEDQVYRCEKIIGRVYDREGNGTDWAVVKLDRKVLGEAGCEVIGEKNFAGSAGICIGSSLWFAVEICVRFESSRGFGGVFWCGFECLQW